MARIACLRKQYRFFYKRKAKMARCGLCFLDKLDTAKAKESEKREARDRKVFAPVFDVLDLPNILGLDNFDPDPVFWKTLGFFNKTL
jgi:hypothetical protein